MNTSTLVNMIKEDSTILNDIPAFLKRINEKNILNKYSVKIETIENEEMISFAEQHGGEATESDIDYAVFLIKQEPLVDEVKARFEKVQALIQSGEVKDSTDIVAKLTEALDAVAVEVP